MGDNLHLYQSYLLKHHSFILIYILCVVGKVSPTVKVQERFVMCSLTRHEQLCFLFVSHVGGSL